MSILKSNTIKMLASALCSLVIACGLSSNALAADSSSDDDQVISKYYQISSGSLGSLKQTIATESDALAVDLKNSVVLEDYIAALAAPGYDPYIKEYVSKISINDLNLLIDAEFLKLYNIFVDKISDDEFAAIFKQYLGELTASYLMAPTDQDFTEFVLSQTLRLTKQDYSNLYRDYISTLWKYYVSSATPQELTQILGDDYLNTVSSANMAVEDDRYFALLAEHITSISESDFITDYGVYITETVGGLLVDSLTASPKEGLQVDAPAPQEAVASSSGVETAGESKPQPQAESSFTQLSTQESVRLIRRHIASVARSYFLKSFKQDLINVTSSYTVELDSSLLITLFGIEDFKSMVGTELAARNARNQREIDSLIALSDDRFVGDLRLKLRLVENIPYPNRRLLEIAVNYALESYSAGAILAENKLPDDQFNILLDAILNTIIVYDASGPVSGSGLLATSVGETVPASSAAAIPVSVPAASGDIRWKFPGCGCEISDANSIYGFYPSWAAPKPGSEPQQIDLRYYNRVAYFGTSIDEQGSILDDDDWRENGPLNDFILDAHIRMTEIDLGIHARNWQNWQGTTLTARVDNIIDKLSIPLNPGLLTSFASKYLPYIYPTRSETIGKDNMGDGVTIYFDDLDSSKLTVIIRFITQLSNALERTFPRDVPGINLMLDLDKENTQEILGLLKPLILGSQTHMNRYVKRVLVFLEQDTWSSSQGFTASVKTVFKDDDSAAVLKKIIPILIPAKDTSNKFTFLSRDLRNLRGTFGNVDDRTAGGAAIWPIPIDNPEVGLLVNSLAIKGALNSAMADEAGSAGGFWKNLRASIRVLYFESRLWLIFFMTAIYSISMLILLWSIREPIRPTILMTSKILGGFSFVLFMVSCTFIDPYINPLRIAFFVLPIIIVFFIVPLQSSAPAVSVSPNITGNRYVKREIKKQKSRVLRGLRRKVKQGIWSQNDS